MYIELCIGAWIQRQRLGIVEIELPCTPREVMNAVFNFYQRPLTLDFLTALRKPNKKLDDYGNEFVDTEDDSFCHTASRTLSHGDALVKYHDIMGDLHWFNGLYLESGITYSVLLGTPL
jgi:hypothetical protein